MEEKMYYNGRFSTTQEMWFFIPLWNAFSGQAQILIRSKTNSVSEKCKLMQYDFADIFSAVYEQVENIDKWWGNCNCSIQWWKMYRVWQNLAGDHDKDNMSIPNNLVGEGEPTILTTNPISVSTVNILKQIPKWFAINH